MSFLFTAEQLRSRESFREFAGQTLAPRAAEFDREERLPDDIVSELARAGFLGQMLPRHWGGGQADPVTYGLMHEELAKGCSSTRSLVTVHDMVAESIRRWGSAAQKARWLPVLASGETLAAFALSEPNVGSDATSVESEATPDGAGAFRLHGTKRWISFGQIADLFLVFARCHGQPTAFLVEKGAPGLSVRPMRGLLGLRASMLAEVDLADCEVTTADVVGGIGCAQLSVLPEALRLGRYSVAWGCVGIAQACLDASLAHAGSRSQFGGPIAGHQLVQAMIAEMVANTHAARLVCWHAGQAIADRHTEAVMESFTAKYVASRTALLAAGDAVQIHGAQGCRAPTAVERHFRDAKVMEIIEGSTQIQQVAIAQYALRADDGRR